MARILVAEHQEDYYLSIAGALRRRGHHVDVATSVADAKALIQANTYALLLIDAGLPKPGGLVFVADMQRRYGDALAPVILMIGNGPLGPGVNAAAAEAMNPCAVIRLPANLQKLLKTVDDALASSKDT